MNGVEQQEDKLSFILSARLGRGSCSGVLCLVADPDL